MVTWVTWARNFRETEKPQNTMFFFDLVRTREPILLRGSQIRGPYVLN